MVWRVASGAGSTTSGHTSGRQSSLTTLLFLPGSSQADRSIPSPIKLSLDRPELGSNPHRSPLRQRRLIAVCEPTHKRKKLPRALARRPRRSIPQNKTIVYGRALANKRKLHLREYIHPHEIYA